MFSALNVCCLAIGISFCLLIGEYILQEKAINSNLKSPDRQFLLSSTWKIKNMGMEVLSIGPVSKTLRIRYPDLVSNYYRFNPVTNVVSAGDQHFKEDIAIGDTTLISMYGYPLLYGDPAHAFTNNRSTVITAELAIKLFGRTDVLNKTVTLTHTTGTTQDYTVSAVLNSMPFNTVNNLLSPKGYGMYVPFEGNHYYPGSTSEDDWAKGYTVSFIRLQPGADPQRLEKLSNDLVKSNAPENISKNLKVSLKPLATFYLDNNNRAVARTLSILSLIALGILFLAVVNFINIMIGGSAYRIKEIGLRKVFGGRRYQLIAQYLVEAVVLTTFSAILSMLLYHACRPLFNDLLHTRLPSIWSFHPLEIGWLLLLTFGVGVLAGIYPSFILSRTEIVSAVKGKAGSVEKGMWLRKSLLVLQFSLAIAVFIFSMTISKQVRFFFEKDLGYDKDQLMVISAFPKQWDSVGVARMESIRNGLMTSAAVKDATVSFEIPERLPPNVFSVVPEGARNNQTVTIQNISVDERFGSTYGLHLLEGRFFRELEGGFVSGETVITQTAMKDFGWKHAIGKKIHFADGTSITVVGVVGDYNQSTLHEAMMPLAFTQVKDANAYRYLTLKLKPGLLSASIDQVKKRWKELTAGSPFEYFFMDEKLQTLYQSERELKKAADIATGLMLFIVLLGIFGVLSLALAKRTREIAVRKILGAQVLDILSLFFREYAGLLLIATIIAWPLAYYFTNRWLEQFAYRIVQPFAVYMIAAVVLMLAAFVLISLQCLRVARSNPAETLHTD